jgi:hypothetical protein
MHRHSLRCDHRFRGPKPQLLLAEAVGFFRSGCSSGCPAELITQPTSDWQILFSQPFQPSTGATLEICLKIVNALFRCKRAAAICQNPEMQAIELLRLDEREISFFPFLHNNMHR